MSDDEPSNVIGVDEAGKGPVLGSMFVAGVRTPGDGFDFEVRDSKKLSEPRRREIYGRLTEYDYSVVEVTPQEIDEYVDEGGMNRLVVEAQSEAVRRLDPDGDEKIVVDASDTSAERFGRRVSEETGYEVTAEHGADESYDAVAGASVIAKVERDSHIESLGDVGSGYPSDSKTIEYLREYVEENRSLPGFARESWSTAERILDEAKQSGIDDF
ncbi:ribonuclease HII [Halorutilales archaeon Cl-col2-1]